MVRAASKLAKQDAVKVSDLNLEGSEDDKVRKVEKLIML